MRGLIAWLLTLPLTGAGLFLAHELSYRAVEPHTHERGELLQSTGHGYFSHLPLAAGLGASLLLVAFGLVAARAARGAAAARLRIWPFAVLPPLAFAVQEHAERMVHTGEIPFSTAIEPTFVLGLLLQAPFALAALLVARALLAVAERFGALAVSAQAAPIPESFAPPPRRADQARRPVLARGWAGRAPPPLPLAV
jgi:hypothetical protein